MPLDPTHRFSDRVDNYVKHRPSYPPELLTVLEEAIGLNANQVIADVGSGTGISTALLLKHGNPVYAVEPNASMRAAAEQLLGSHRKFHSVNGIAAATTLADASVDAVTVMQAFHWFDPILTRCEFARILKPGGWVVLVWNERQTDSTPFLQAYERLLMQFGTDYEKVKARRPSEAVLEPFFGPAGYQAHAIPNEQTFDFDGLAGRLLSSSYAPAKGQPGHEPMMSALQRIFEQFQQGGVVRFVYDTLIYCGQISS